MDEVVGIGEMAPLNAVVLEDGVIQTDRNFMNLLFDEVCWIFDNLVDEELKECSGIEQWLRVAVDRMRNAHTTNKELEWTAASTLWPWRGV